MRLTLPPAMDELEARLAELTAGDETRAEEATLALSRLAAQGRAAEVLAAAAGLAASPVADQRWWAARLLAELPGDQAVPGLLQALRDPDASVRQCAALGLRLHPTAEAVEPLVAALYDIDPLVVTLAEDALEQVGELAVPALLHALESGPRPVQIEAVRALAAIGDQRAIPALIAALEADSALMEYFASQGLERMGVGMVFFKPE